MRIGARLCTVVAASVLLASVSACGDRPDDVGAHVAQTSAVEELPSPISTTTDNSAAEAAAKAQADAAEAAAAAQAKAAAEAAAAAQAKAAAEAKAKAAAAAKAKAAAAAKARAAAAAKAKAAAAAKAKADAAAAAAAEQAQAEEVFYENCTAVRAAGADPIHRGDPGYSTDLDRDQDGVACE